jgi:Flp pilus assembly protein TadG
MKRIPTSQRHQAARRRRGGNVALEFALVGVPLFGLILFTLQLSFRLYEQIAVDYVTLRAARLLEVDSSHTLSTSAATFKTATFCPLLAPLLNCASLVIALRPVASDYLTDSQANPPTLHGALTQPAFSAGGSGSLMLLQVTYIGPTMSWPLNLGQTATLNGASGSAIVSSVPYENEY